MGEKGMSITTTTWQARLEAIYIVQTYQVCRTRMPKKKTGYTANDIIYNINRSTATYGRRAIARCKIPAYGRS
jgi:hypothetical protein